MLILCGSMIGFMEREVLGAKSPLFGRRTAQIHLQPFGFQEATAFHPRWSRTDQAKVRFVVGGVASYLHAFDPARSFEQNLIANLLSEFAPLFQEPEFLLREELREVASYHAVLSAIAAGETSIRGIATASGLPERGQRSCAQADDSDVRRRRNRSQCRAERTVGMEVRGRNLPALDEPALRAVQGRPVNETDVDRRTGHAGHAVKAAQLVQRRLDEMEVEKHEHRAEERGGDGETAGIGEGVEDFGRVGVGRSESGDRGFGNIQQRTPNIEL